MEYMDIAMKLLYDIRLRIEGAAELYENDASPLRQLAIENDMLTAAVAFDTIGSALYSLREDIQSLQEAHSKDCLTTKGSPP